MHNAETPSCKPGGPELCLLLSAFAIGVFAISWPIYVHGGFPLDDSWIHQVIGRNIAETGIPGFSPGVVSSGSSSTIWPWIIALNYYFFSFIQPWLYLLLINSICLFAILMVIFAAGRRDRLPLPDTLLLASLPAITGNFIWLLSIGMEHLFMAAMVFLAAYFWTVKSGESSVVQSLISGFFLGLAILSRSEAVLFVPVFLAWSAYFGRKRIDIVIFSVVCAIAVSVVVLYNLWTSHALLPVTMSGRSWLFLNQISSPMRHELDLVKAWGERISVLFVGFGEDSRAIKAITLLATFFFAASGLWRLLRQSAWRVLFLITLAAASVVPYAVMLPIAGHGGRYQVMLMIFVFPLIALGTLELADWITARYGLPRSNSQYIKFAAVTLVVMLALGSTARWSRLTGQGLTHINETHVRMGKWIAGNLEPDADVASFDIGAIAYFSRARVLDLGGLTDPKSIPYLFQGRSIAYLREHGIRFLVMPMGGGPDSAASSDDGCGLERRLGFDDTRMLEKLQVVAFSTAFDIWIAGLKATGHACQRQALYEIRQTGHAAASAD
jgi:hypothetical protein